MFFNFYMKNFFCFLKLLFTSFLNSLLLSLSMSRFYLTYSSCIYFLLLLILFSSYYESYYSHVGTLSWLFCLGVFLTVPHVALAAWIMPLILFIKLFASASISLLNLLCYFINNMIIYTLNKYLCIFFFPFFDTCTSCWVLF